MPREAERLIESSQPPSAQVCRLTSKCRLPRCADGLSFNLCTISSCFGCSYALQVKSVETTNAGGPSDLRGQPERLECQRSPARQLLRELPQEEELPFLCPNFMSDTPQPSCMIRSGRVLCLESFILLPAAWHQSCLQVSSSQILAAQQNIL